MNISVLQNSVPYINHTVLQSIDRQRVAETRLFHAISYHLQSICADYQLFATYGGHQFFPPLVVILDLTAYMMDLSLKVEDSERHLQYICAGYQLFAIEGGCCFFHLKYVFIEYHPIEAEGGRYGRSRSICFCRQDLKRQNNLILRVGLLYRFDGYN